MSDSRIEQLRAEVDDLKVKTAGGSADRPLLILGIVLMVAGIALAFISYVVAGGQNSGNLAIDNLEHNESIILAITGLAMSVVGAALFLRYSLAGFLRFWLLRQLYEGQANTAELVSQLRQDD